MGPTENMGTLMGRKLRLGAVIIWRKNCDILVYNDDRNMEGRKEAYTMWLGMTG